MGYISSDVKAYFAVSRYFSEKNSINMNFTIKTGSPEVKASFAVLNIKSEFSFDFHLLLELKRDGIAGQGDVKFENKNGTTYLALIEQGKQINLFFDFQELSFFIDRIEQLPGLTFENIIRDEELENFLGSL